MVVVESDKADMDVETFYDGILAAIVVGEGEVRQNNVEECVVTQIPFPCQNDGDASIRGRRTTLGFPAFHIRLVEIVGVPLLVPCGATGISIRCGT